MTGKWKATLVSLSCAWAIVGVAYGQEVNKPIRIGILSDQSGVYSSITGLGSTRAAEIAVQEMGGTVLGRKIEVVSGNHQLKADIGATMARRWFDVDNVLAVFDSYHSGVSLAVQRVAEEKNGIFVVSMASSKEIGGKSCSPNAFQWANDGYAVSNLTVNGAIEADKNAGVDSNTWFFLTVDYTAGHSIEADASKLVRDAGGAVKGSARFPIGASDFAAFLLQAQASGAKKIGVIAGGTDLINIVKQGAEFGVEQGGQKLVPFSLTTEDVYALGNDVAQGAPVVLSYYWNETPETLQWAENFKKHAGKYPTDPQANVYSAVKHYLKAVEAAGTTDTSAVLAKMKALPVNDVFTHDAKLRADGRLMRDMYYAVAKPKAEMKNPDDLLTLVKRYSGQEAFVPVALSECPALKP